MTELLAPLPAADITNFLTPQTLLLAGAVTIPLLFLSLISMRSKLSTNIHDINSPRYAHLRRRIQQRRKVS